MYRTFYLLQVKSQSASLLPSSCPKRLAQLLASWAALFILHLPRVILFPSFPIHRGLTEPQVSMATSRYGTASTYELFARSIVCLFPLLECITTNSPSHILQMHFKNHTMAKWQREGFNDDPFMSPFVDTNITYKWGNQFTRPSRFSGMRVTPFRIGLLLLTIGGFVILRDWIAGSMDQKVSMELRVIGSTALQLLDQELINVMIKEYNGHIQHDQCSSSGFPTSRIRRISNPRYHRHLPILQVPKYMQCLLTRSPRPI